MYMYIHNDERHRDYSHVYSKNGFVHLSANKLFSLTIRIHVFKLSKTVTIAISWYIFEIGRPNE